jgi:signal transduction histidine kinase
MRSDRPSGLPGVAGLSWGSHLCQFFANRDDLASILVPFFRAGLENDERCLWITSHPLPAPDACAALAAEVPDLDERLRRGQIEILDHEDWYLQAGRLGGEAVLRNWLDREAQALVDGYAGLRLSANTYWLEQEDWAEFQTYEASVHRAFAGRRIIALCSYPLESCGPEQLMDVVRNHGQTLIRHGAQWEVLQSATHLLAAVDSHCELGRHNHAVRLFEDEAYPADEIARYLKDGLTQGAATIVFATEPHLEAISQALAELGIDHAAARSEGRLVTGDATAIAGRVVVGGQPRRPVFDEVIGGAVSAALARCGRVRAYGEIVDVLSRGRDPDSAVTLEQWWNELLAGKPAELLCGYALHSFADAGSVSVFRRMCATHGEVVPVGGSRDVAAAGDGDGKSDGGNGNGKGNGGNGKGRDRLLARLQQSSAALLTESRERARAEQQRDRLRQEEQTARLRALQVADQMGRLQRVTSALAEVATIGEIAGIVCGDLADVSGAAAATLAIPVDGDGWLQLLDRRGAQAGEPEVLRTDSPLPLAQAFRAGRPQWLSMADERGDGVRTLACLPLLLRGRSLGAIELEFAGSYEPPVSERALIEDQARQVAIAVDRAASYEVAERARDQAEQERLRAESASRAKDEFLAMLGHELRNPLSPIVTALQLMKLRGDNRSTREQTIIERQVQHLVRLVDDLLDVSRITRGKVELRRREIDVSDVIARAVEMASPLLEERQHHFTVSSPRVPLRVNGDGDRLTQVITNLLSNAAKYTPHRGHIDLSASREGEAVVIRVKDTGIGIPTELLNTIFEPFVQGPRASDRADGGLGLGLMLVRSLVQMHGGSVSAFSEGPGRGSELIVRLPALVEVDEALAEPITTEIPIKFRQVAAHRVLVVDDNRDAAEILADVLRDAGHAVDVAHDGPSALERARGFQPDVAVLDIGLPVMDGYELAERLRIDHPRLWMVAVTGYGREHDRVRSKQSGFGLHLVKPVDLEAILAAVEPGTGR